MNDRECPGPTLERCARVLGVKVEQLRLVGEGANGLIVSDGSGVAYKFPKNRIALQSLKEEITYTKKLSHVLSVAVPEYLLVHLEQPLGEAFCAYRLLRGVSLTPAIYAAHRQSLSGQLSALLREIHAIRLPAACKEPMDFAKLYREIQQYLFAQMSREEQRQVSGRFEEYLSHTTPEERCIVHGDLGAAGRADCGHRLGRAVAGRSGDGLFLADLSKEPAAVPGGPALPGPFLTGNLFPDGFYSVHLPTSG